MEWAIVSDNFHLRIHCPSELYCHHDLQLTCHHCTQSEKHEDSNKYGFAGDGHNGLAHDRLSIPMVSNFRTLYIHTINFINTLANLMDLFHLFQGLP